MRLLGLECYIADDLPSFYDRLKSKLTIFSRDSISELVANWHVHLIKLPSRMIFKIPPQCAFQ